MITDRGIKLVDILENKDRFISGACIVARRLDEDGVRKDYSNIPVQYYLQNSANGKAPCITTVEKDSLVSYMCEKRTLLLSRKKEYLRNYCREFTLTELERLQTLPDAYTRIEGISSSRRRKMIGNGWTVDVIAHIFKGLTI